MFRVVVEKFGIEVVRSKEMKAELQRALDDHEPPVLLQDVLNDSLVAGRSSGGHCCAHLGIDDSGSGSGKLAAYPCWTKSCTTSTLSHSRRHHSYSCFLREEKGSSVCTWQRQIGG